MDDSKEHYLKKRVKETLFKLLDFCKKNYWAGYDPYDALNSKLLNFLPFLNFRLFRIGLTQLLKRSPIDFRPMLFVPKTENPKAIALFLRSLLKLDRLGLLDDKDLIPLMLKKIIDLRSKGTLAGPACSNNDYWNWGYSFPWQTREIVVRRGAPNIVCTYFVASALLDAYERYGVQNYLNIAESAAEYIANELYWTEGDSVACFSYFRYPVNFTPHIVHNVNLLGAALLSRVQYFTGQKKFLGPALKVARYTAAKQRNDGSWDYGEHHTHHWIDNFHTGYILCALESICRHAETTEFESHIRRGFEFYHKHFFLKNGSPRYFHNRTYPIDIHCVAQSIITMLTLEHYDEKSASQAQAVLEWGITKMWDNEGYFYYQVLPFFTNKIQYIRWSQAWMLLALSTVLEYCSNVVIGTGGRGEVDPKVRCEAKA